jgi:catalase
VDTAPGQNPHVNYEPSSLSGLTEAPRDLPDHTPYVEGRLVRASIERTNNFQQAGEQYRTFEDWERDDLIANLVENISAAQPHVQRRMIELFTQCDPDYGRRVAEGLAAHAVASRTEKEGAAVRQAEERAKEAQPY